MGPEPSRWGRRNALPLVFHHGWPLSRDDWDTQLLYFVGKGYRVIAHDRRGHGRSSQVSDGHDMDHYAADVTALVERRPAAERRCTTWPATASNRAAWPSWC